MRKLLTSVLAASIAAASINALPISAEESAYMSYSDNQLSIYVGMKKSGVLVHVSYENGRMSSIKTLDVELDKNSSYNITASENDKFMLLSDLNSLEAICESLTVKTGIPTVTETPDTETTAIQTVEPTEIPDVEVTTEPKSTYAPEITVEPTIAPDEELPLDEPMRHLNSATGLIIAVPVSDTKSEGWETNVYCSDIASSWENTDTFEVVDFNNAEMSVTDDNVMTMQFNNVDYENGTLSVLLFHNETKDEYAALQINFSETPVRCW